ncbi:MAG: hypothetical protein AVDCRST_MAG17-1529, partial [uncultured Solirubrobacterales bacterium]
VAAARTYARAAVADLLAEPGRSPAEECPATVRPRPIRRRTRTWRPGRRPQV